MSGPKELKARPTCAVCAVPVESFTEEVDQHTGKVIYVARCHGRSERIRIDREVVEDARSVDFGLAFGTSNALPAPPPQRALPPIPGDPTP